MKESIGIQSINPNVSKSELSCDFYSVSKACRKITIRHPRQQRFDVRREQFGALGIPEGPQT
jgi:hypothetical protein